MKFIVSYPMPEHLNGLFPDVEHITVECDFAEDGTLLRPGYVTLYHHHFASTNTRIPKDICLMTAEQMLKLGQEIYDWDFEREAGRQFSERCRPDPDFAFERWRDSRVDA